MNSPTHLGVTALYGGRLAGFVVASAAAGEAEILTLCVSPQYRRRAVGSLLIIHLVEALKGLGATTLFLEVSVANRAAEKLYRKCRFQDVGRRPAYYTTPDGPVDALIMRLDFGAE